MTLHELNALPASEAVTALLQCCGSHRWATRVAASRPFADTAALHAVADGIWNDLDTAGWLEAFRAHPRIGERKPAAPGGATAAEWSAREQAGMDDADAVVATDLAAMQRVYEDRFGHIFLICASGLSAREMLANIRMRMNNNADEELRVAAEEQRRITHLRLEKLLEI